MIYTKACKRLGDYIAGVCCKGVKIMRSSDELKKEWLKDEKFAEAYDLKRPLRIFIRAIKTARVEKGLSQKDLAGAIGTSQPVITRIEAGKQNISYEMTSKLSDTFGLRLYIFATSEEALTLPKELCDRLRKTTGTDESGEISDIVSSMLKSRLKIEKEVGKNLEF
jgi:transcriptional regulator with XRE-family HTH domain